MKCIDADGYVTYTRICSQNNTVSEIQMDVTGNVIQSTDDDNRITTYNAGTVDVEATRTKPTANMRNGGAKITNKNHSSTITAKASNGDNNTISINTTADAQDTISTNNTDSVSDHTNNNDSIIENAKQEKNPDSNSLDNNTATRITDSDGPVITNAKIELEKQDARVVITGSQFGSREGQAAPILFDFTEVAYENGVENAHHKSFEDGQAILRIDEDPKALWYKSSNHPPPLFTLSRPQRHENSKAHYYLEGENSFLGWPSAYGGLDPPVNNKKLYIAWWLKIKYDPRYYWSVSREDSSGTFKTHELVEINGIRGIYIGQSNKGISKNMEQFIFSGQINANKMKGHIISGLKSGATTRFPTTFAGATGAGYLSPGANKYIRVWNKSDGHDLRLSWTQRQVWQKSISDSSYHADINVGGWSLMQLWLDFDKGNVTARVNVNGAEFTSDINIDTVNSILSPTIALLGFNGKIQVFQITEVDDIYFDNRFSHIAISEKPEYSSLNSYEHQLITSWKNNQIEFKLNLGSINPDQEYYLYVITEEGKVNKNGFKL
ncbi:uncharacterized protein (UPF0333 family) [Methylohalomonas lacus]|uniref:Uncharacterized protein (UPF0333 family) n=1 Tax=Methylohalomonas lacus TaxID=398773 RepID=A0AAE3L4R7_9GAMM|nr:hypothetical protein [Methylohalomonas lacus]MCS3904328.1 uncharacterized protein (UPF0333 family) [Methylohalomonas lacus]